MRELGIVACGQLQALLVGKSDQLFGLGRGQSERLLDEKTTSPFQANLTQLKMAWRWRRNVNYIGLCRTQHLLNVRKVLPDVESLGHLPGHQRLAVAHSNNLSARNPTDLKGMLIRHLSAADDADPDHLFSPSTSRM
jgi:hypothetical protein